MSQWTTSLCRSHLTQDWLSDLCVTSDLCVGALGDLSEVVLSSGGDPSKEDLLGDSSSQSHTHPVEQLLSGVQVLLLRQVLSITQAPPPGDDGHLHRWRRRWHSIRQCCQTLSSSWFTQHHQQIITFTSFQVWPLAVGRHVPGTIQRPRGRLHDTPPSSSPLAAAPESSSPDLMSTERQREWESESERNSQRQRVRERDRERETETETENVSTSNSISLHWTHLRWPSRWPVQSVSG